MEVLDESSANWWQVRSKFSGSGNVPARILEIVRKKTKGKDRVDEISNVMCLFVCMCVYLCVHS